MKKIDLTISTQTELSTHIQSICNEIVDFKKNETVRVENALNILTDGFDLHSSEIEKITSILEPKQNDSYEKLVSDRKPLLSSLCNILNLNMFDKGRINWIWKILKRELLTKNTEFLLQPIPLLEMWLNENF